jgi:hypothetical protein
VLRPTVSSITRISLGLVWLGLAVACNEISLAESDVAPTPERCVEWTREYTSNLQLLIPKAERSSADQERARQLAPKVERCQYLGHVPHTIPIMN